ncbi:MAG: hypothetical protein QMC36_06520 [Patescibacteria group bacterium]
MSAELAIRDHRNGHLEDLSPLAEYLGSALESRDYPLLSRRVAYLDSALGRNSVSNEASDVFALLDEKKLAEACSAI